MLFEVADLVIAFYFLAATVPAFYLLKKLRKVEGNDKEPLSLLLILLLLGALSTLPAMLLESLGTYIFASIGIDSTTGQGAKLYMYLVVGVAEECSKYFFMKKKTWKDPNFDYRFDGLIYAVTTSLGFAALENILYVFRGGLSVAVMRAFTSIPGHATFGVVMGAFYGRAKRAEHRGSRFASFILRLFGLFAAILLHGFYDATVVGENGNMMIFLLFVAGMYLLVTRFVKIEAKKDRHI
jgi:Predicted membrane protein